jgi:diguanylate cyclase (GGDEF)-like protein
MVTIPFNSAFLRALPVLQHVMKAVRSSLVSRIRGRCGAARGYWGTLGFGVKLHLLIQGVLLLVLLGAQAWITDRFRRHILDAAEARAKVSADGVINGMNMLMETGSISDPENRKLHIRKMGASEGVLQLRIIRAGQVQQQFGPGLPEEQAADDMDRRAIESRQPQYDLSDNAAHPSLRAVVPFIVSTNFRGTNCLQCHRVSAGSVNGAASVTLDLSGDFAMIARINRMLWLGQFAVQGILFVLIGSFTRRLTRPLKRLEAVMSSVQFGADLSRRQPQDLQVIVSGRDEVGRLSSAFNRMVTALHEQQTRLVSLLSAMDLGIMFVSSDDRVTQLNPAFFDIWDVPPSADLIGKDVQCTLDLLAERVVLPPDLGGRSPLHLPEHAQVGALTLQSGRIVSLERYDVYDPHRRSVGLLWIFKDITDDRRTAEKLAFLAERDALTGLYNRHRFQQELERTLASSQRAGTPTALILFDLDGFKYANDNFGHGAGDQVLVRVANELSTVVRRSDILFRLGGDEFTVLVAGTSVEEIQVLAQRIVRTIAKIPFRFEGTSVPVTASVGIAMFPSDAVNASDLVAHADAAMYQAKAAGGNDWRVYEPRRDVSREMLSRHILQSHIDEAISQGSLRLHFQGIYRIDGGLSHLEALVRMVDPLDPSKLLPPEAFIGLAERSGKILALDRWVVREAIARLADSPDIPPIAVNISGRSFSDPGLAGFIEDEIRRAGISPRRLLFEVTETSVIADVVDARHFIDSLHRTGCRVCLDDFGTGFSSLVYLKHLDFDIVKIDATFIHSMARDPVSHVIVRAVALMAHELDKKVVAEGVEDRRTLELLSQIGTQFVQGYLFDRPCADHPALSGGAVLAISPPD